MNDFLENSTLIFANIKELKKIADHSQEYISLKQTSVMTDEQEAAIDGKIEELDNNFDKISNSIKNAIKAAQDETNELAKHGELEESEVEMRNVHTHKFYKELKQTIFNYRNLKSDSKSKEKDLLRQAYQIVNPKTDENSVDKILSEPDADGAMNSAFSLGGNSAKRMLATAKNRRKKIDRIVEVINRLVALIEEIDGLVKSNTGVVDEIVINMTQAERHTEQANRELESSLVYQRRINFFKKLALGIICVIVFFFIIYIAISRGGGSQTIYMKGDMNNNP